MVKNLERELRFEDRAPFAEASEFARSFAVADTFVRNYLDILNAALVVRQLQPWHENIFNSKALHFDVVQPNRAAIIFDIQHTIRIAGAVALSGCCLKTKNKLLLSRMNTLISPAPFDERHRAVQFSI